MKKLLIIAFLLFIPSVCHAGRCVGTASACSTFGNEGTCAAQSGCSWVDSCNDYVDIDTCGANPPCLWNSRGDDCTQVTLEENCTGCCIWQLVSLKLKDENPILYAIRKSLTDWVVEGWADGGAGNCVHDDVSYSCNICEGNASCSGTATACSAFTTYLTCTPQGGCSWARGIIVE